MNRKKWITSFNKVSLSAFVIALVAPALSGCTNSTGLSDTEQSTSTPSGTETSEMNQLSSSDNDNDDALSAITTDAIVVDEARCIGCGKCPRFAPENFAMDPMTGKAYVTSQENATDTDVQRAKSACPTDAINA